MVLKDDKNAYIFVKKSHDFAASEWNLNKQHLLLFGVTICSNALTKLFLKDRTMLFTVLEDRSDVIGS